MKATWGTLTAFAMTCFFSAYPITAEAQWYVNPVNGGGGNGINVMDYATNSLLYGSGIPPGSNLVPGYGLFAGGGAIPNGDPAAYGGGNSYNYSYVGDPISAYQGAVYNGMANLIRSEGAYNRMTASAMVDYEKARTAYVDNQLKIQSARRAIYRARLAALNEDREYAHVALERANNFLAAHKPLPLDSRHLEASTGAILWPATLMQPDFDDLRKQVDDDFRSRASHGFDSDANVEIKKHIQDMRNKLHEDVLKYPLENYSKSRQFLDQLLASVD